MYKSRQTDKRIEQKNMPNFGVVVSASGVLVHVSGLMFIIQISN